MWETYYTPTSVDKALHLLAEHSADACIVAGGTDLLVDLQRGTRKACVLIDVTRIGGLNRVRLDDDGFIHIGPTVTHNLAVASAARARVSPGPGLLAGRHPPTAQPGHHRREPHHRIACQRYHHRSVGAGCPPDSEQRAW
jgi:hypothetical protein